MCARSFASPTLSETFHPLDLQVDGEVIGWAVRSHTDRVVNGFGWVPSGIHAVRPVGDLFGVLKKSFPHFGDRDVNKRVTRQCFDPDGTVRLCGRSLPMGGRV